MGDRNKMEFEVDVDEIIRHLQAEFPSTSTWHGRMVAVTEGLVKFDHIEPLLATCATIADEALAAKSAEDGTVSVFSWHEVVSRLFEDFMRLQATPKDPHFVSMCAEFQRCGKIADWWLGKKQEGAE